MSSIIGVFQKNSIPVKKKIFENILNNMDYWIADRKDYLLKNSVGFGHLLLQNTPESKYEKLPYCDSKTGLIITADLRIDNREELLSILRMDQKSERLLTDSLIILEAYKKYGTKCTSYFLGAFAFVIWDPKNYQLFCARDHIGFKPFYYLNSPNLFIFSSDIKGIKAHPEVSLTINEQFVADALATLRSEKDQTFYNEIFRLPPAHQIIVTPQKVEIKRYWDLDPHYELKLSSEAEYIEAFKEKLKEAVHCRLRSAYPVGAELSGGIDSSSIVSLAAKKLSVKTFSHALPIWAKHKYFPYNDESEYSRKVIDFHNIRESFFITGEGTGIIEQLRKGLRLHESVMQGTLSINFEPLYQKVEKENCRTLLSGYGGDEMVSSFGAKYIYDLVTKFRYKKFFHEIRIRNKEKSNLNFAIFFFKTSYIWNITTIPTCL
jgi:asparagine synthase (glutamine-hydrolysing)